MANAWIPAQASRGVPWAAEVADIMQGQPKVSRIPTGGWRGIGAVPSHSYPDATDVPGYWSGMGAVASTTDAQQTKTTAPTSSTSPWLDALKITAVAAGEAYAAQQRYAAFRRTGDPQLLAAPGGGPTGPTAPAAPGIFGGGNTMLIVGGVVAAAGLLFFLAPKRG